MASKTKPQAGISLPNRIRSSLGLKLNLHMFGKLLSAFIFFNTLLIVLSFGTILWKAEEGAQRLVDSIGSAGSSIEDLSPGVGRYSVVRAEDSPKGLVLSKGIQEWLPLDAPDAGRQVAIPDTHRTLPLLQRLGQAEYRIVLRVEENTWRIVYALGADLRLIVITLVIMLCAELLYLLKSLGENAWAIRDALRPLAEMAETARTLQEGMGSLDVATDGAGIKHLAGAISSIDAGQLNRRLSVDTSQDELKALAFNGYLAITGHIIVKEYRG